MTSKLTIDDDILRLLEDGELTAAEIVAKCRSRHADPRVQAEMMKRALPSGYIMERVAELRRRGALKMEQGKFRKV